MAEINVTCTICGKSYIAKSSKSRYCSNECKLSVKYKKDAEKKLAARGGIRECIICGEKFVPSKPSSVCCSKECTLKRNRLEVNESRKNARNDLYKDKVENVDYVVCQICGNKSPQVNNNHLSIHNITLEEYLKQYPNARVSCDAFKQNLVDNNGNATHNTTEQQRKERSPFSKEFYHKRDKDLSERDNLIKDIHSDMVYNTQIEFYLDKCETREDAELLLHNRQQTFTLEKCIERHGKEQGMVVFNARQEKWCESFKRSQKNKGKLVQVSAKCNDFIAKIAEGDKLLFGENELRINRYFYDLTHTETKRIIEFNGDYWHCNPEKYDADYFNKRKKMYAKDIWQYDATKLETAKLNGYEVMVIWEAELAKDPDGIIEKARNFIYNI